MHIGWRYVFDLLPPASTLTLRIQTHVVISSHWNSQEIYNFACDKIDPDYPGDPEDTGDPDDALAGHQGL